MKNIVITTHTQYLVVCHILSYAIPNVTSKNSKYHETSLFEHLKVLYLLPHYLQLFPLFPENLV